MPGVSVIIPCYKRIEQTLKTVQLILLSEGVGNDFKLEVIIADCTPDDSLEKAVKETFADQVIYTRTEKRGIATNKNQGARIAQHNILIFCDSDIEVEVDTLLKTIAGLQSSPQAAMLSGSVFWRGGAKDGEVDRPEDADRRFLYEDVTYIESIYSRYVATYKDIFEKVGGYDETVFNMRGEGADLSIRYWRAGYPLVYDPRIVVYHIFDAPDSVGIRIDNPHYAVARDFFLLAYKYSMTEKNYPHFQQMVNNYFNQFEGPSATITGVGMYLEQIALAKNSLDTFRKNDKPKYDFKFLEVFSDETLLKRCIANAATYTRE